jgi:hypothetical protein
MLQLNPPIPVYVNGRGSGMAHALIDYGIEHHLHWVVFIDATTECWTIPNPQIRAQFNQTMGRVPVIKKCKDEKIKCSSACNCDCHTSGIKILKLSYPAKPCCNCLVA